MPFIFFILVSSKYILKVTKTKLFNLMNNYKKTFDLTVSSIIIYTVSIKKFKINVDLNVY